jgi:hypothetical protein
VIQSWKENMLEIESEKENILDSELEGKYFEFRAGRKIFWKSRVRRKIFCIQSWKENILELEIGKKIVANLSPITWRKSRIDSIRSRDLSKVSHVL